MSSYVEVWGRSGRELRALDSERMTVGTLESNDVVVDADGVSRVHAVFERFGDTWCVRDLGSRNGTFVNGGRIIGERALHSGDEILLGSAPPPVPRPGSWDGDSRDRRGPATHAARARRTPGPVPTASDRRCVHRAGVDPRDRSGARRLRGRGETAPVTLVRQVRRGHARRAETRPARERRGRPRGRQAGRLAPAGDSR